MSLPAPQGARVAGPVPPTARNAARTKFFYGLGAIAFGVKDNGFSVLLLLFYNQVLGLDARLAGLAIMLALVVDAFVDPIIGYASDHLRSRWGRRHPFMYGAALPVALSYLFLFSPPAGLGQGALFAYLLAIAVTVRVCIAFYEIPSAALVAELTDHYDERTSYLSFRFFFGWIGGLTMSVSAFAVFFRPSAAFPVGQLNPAGYSNYGVAAAIIMFAAIIVSSLGTHSAIPHLRPAPPRETKRIRDVFGEIVGSLSSRSAATVLIAGMLISLSAGLTFALVTYFYTFFWKLLPGQISILISGSFLSAFAALLAAPRLSRWFDKRSAALGIAAVMIVIVPVPYLARIAGVFPTNGSPAMLPTLLAFSVVVTALSIVWGILITAMLADVVEDNEVRTGRRSEGVFFAANTFVAKCVSGLGVFASAAIITIADFPQHAVPGQVPERTLHSLAYSYVGAVLLLNLIAAACVYSYRITRRVHDANLVTLAARAAAEGAVTG